MIRQLLSLFIISTTLTTIVSVSAAGAPVTVTRGSSQNINWSVAGSSGCNPIFEGTDYPRAPDTSDSVWTSWTSAVKANVDTQTLTFNGKTGAAFPQTYVFKCTAVGAPSFYDTATVTINDCTGPQIWNGTACAAPSNCTTQWGAVVANGNSTTGYQTSLVAYGSSCVGETQTCTNGNLSPNNYANGSCSAEAAPPAPTNLVLTSNAAGTSVTATWTAPPGYTAFFTRASNQGVNLGAPAWDDNFVGTSITFPTTPGETYSFWIHTRSPLGAPGPSTSGSITTRSPSATFDVAPSLCTVAVNQRGCSANLTWTFTDVSGVSLQDCGGGAYASTANAGTVFVPNGNPTGSGCYRLMNNDTGLELTRKTVAPATCAVGTAGDWVNPGTGGYLGYCRPTITSSAGVNGTISPSGATIVVDAANQSYTITPDSQHSIASVVVDGVPQGSLNSTPFMYTFNSVVVSHSISATFTSPTGSITPGAACSIATTASTCNRTFSWSTTNPYGSSQIIADGGAGPNSALAVSGSQPLALKYGSNTLRLINNFHELDVVGPITVACTSGGAAWNGGTCEACLNGGCGAITPHVCNNTAVDPPTCTPPTYQINTAPGANGTISPAGPITATYGDSILFNILPNLQYSISTVDDNGTALGPVSSYNMTPIHEIHTLTASFTQPTGTLTTGASCKINTGNSTCNQIFTTTSANTYGSSQITSNNVALNTAANIPASIMPGFPKTIAMPHGGPWDFYLYNHAKELARVTGINIECTSGNAAYNGTTCEACTNNGVSSTGCTNHVCNNGAADAPTCTPPQFTINISTGLNGTIYLAGVPVGPTVTVTYGDTKTFTIVPDSTYAIGSVTKDSGALGPAFSDPFTVTFNSIQANGHTLDATFVHPSANSFIVNPITCSMDAGESSCPVNVTWSVNNAFGIPAVIIDRPAPNTVVYTGVSGGPSPVTILGPPGVTNVYLYNNAWQMGAQAVTTSCMPNKGWDNVSGKCVVDPQVTSAVITGDYYFPTGTFTLKCSDSNNYKIIKVADGSVVDSGAYTPNQTVVYNNLTVTGDYQAVCLMGSYPTPTPQVRIYHSPPPNPEIVSLTATPRTINKDESTTIAWEVKFPSNTCSLTARVACAGGVCSAAQTAFQVALSGKLTSEATDTNDPHTSRNITSAITTLAPGEQGTTWRGYGKKTFKVSYTTDFTLACGGKSEVKRVQISKSTEQ